MYNTHPLAAFCRCQFVSCNKNTLHEMTGLNPAGCTQTGYNTSLVSRFVLYYLCLLNLFLNCYILLAPSPVFGNN